jgi:hypothetical protein
LGALVVSAALVSASGAATTKTQKVVRIDVSTRAAVVRYLRSVHVNPTGVVIQRGARNYAGAQCPGKGWSCTATTHPVVQVASAGGTNTFRCATAKCAVLQVAASPATGTNTATCIITLTAQSQVQSCTVVQSSSTANNKAVVYEQATATAGPAQTATMKATITQTATGASNSNTACVFQGANLSRSASVSHGALNVAQTAHQTVTITQNSSHGGNSASNSATSAGACDTANPLTQTQTLSSTAAGPGSVTQRQNAGNNGANVTIDVEQNQAAGFKGVSSGANSAIFDQTNALSAVADSPNGPIGQTQSSVNGGILGTINQDSSDVSTAGATQTETQCEDAAKSGLTTCDTEDPDASEAPASLTQTQIGPVRKGVGTATQTGNPNDVFTVGQASTQDNDQGGGSNQTNLVQGDCSTDGNCTVSQNTDVNGTENTNTQSGQDVDTTTTCNGSDCQVNAPPMPTITSMPPNPSNSSFAEFAFSDTQEGVSFLCQIDDNEFSACSSPQDYFDLSDGEHTFSVEAMDESGNVSDPATYSWTIDTVPSFAQSGSLLTADNVNVAEFGYGGMRANAGGDGTGTITVGGVTGTVLKALLFWNGPTSVASPDSDADVTFADTPVTGTNIGTASSNCWDFSGYTNSQSYEADVTGLVAGDGTYGLSDFVKTDGDTVTADINGVSLVVFFDDGDGSNNRNVVLWSGNDSNVLPFDPQTNTYPPDPWDETLTGVPYTGAGTPSLDFVVGDGQNTGNPSFDDGAILVNGTQIVPAGGIFEGASTPAGPASSSGDLWDVESFLLPPGVLSVGSNSLEVTSPFVNDCLSLVALAANMPAFAQEPPVEELQHPQPAPFQRPAAPGSASAGTGGFARRR